MKFKNYDKVVFIKDSTIIFGLGSGVTFDKLGVSPKQEIILVNAGTVVTVISQFWEDEVEIMFDDGNVTCVDPKILIQEEAYNTPLYNALREED